MPELNIHEEARSRYGPHLVIMEMWDGKGEPPKYTRPEIEAWVKAAEAEATHRGLVFRHRNHTPLEWMTITDGLDQLYFRVKAEAVPDQAVEEDHAGKDEAQLSDTENQEDRELTPIDRARYAWATLRSYQIHKEGEADSFEDDADVLTDLISDLLHYCDSRGINFAGCEQRARDFYLHEIGAFGTAPTAPTCDEYGYPIYDAEFKSVDGRPRHLNSCP